MGHLQNMGITDQGLEDLIGKCDDLTISLMKETTTMQNTLSLHRIPVHSLIPFKSKQDVTEMFKVKTLKIKYFLMF